MGLALSQHWFDGGPLLAQRFIFVGALLRGSQFYLVNVGHRIDPSLCGNNNNLSVNYIQYMVRSIKKTHDLFSLNWK